VAGGQRRAAHRPLHAGAELTEATGDGAYRGNMKVKIGPVQLQFNGEARLYEVDPAAHTMKMRSRASDVKAAAPWRAR
jgi:carbon monoxide dehydrogenase subunit G